MNKFLTYVMSVLIISAAAFIVFWFLLPRAMRSGHGTGGTTT